MGVEVVFIQKSRQYKVVSVVDCLSIYLLPQVTYTIIIIIIYNVHSLQLTTVRRLEAVATEHECFWNFVHCRAIMIVGIQLCKVYFCSLLPFVLFGMK